MPNEKALIPNEVREIPFYEDILPVASINNIPYVALRPINDLLGLDWSAQYRRVQRDEVLRDEIKLVIIQAADGKQYETLSLPLEYLPGWLFGINVSRVKPELKDKMIRYQRECFRILWQAFQSRAAAPDIIPQLVNNQAETRAEVETVKQDMKALDQSVKEIKEILSEIRGLSSTHRATAQKMVNEISKISGVKHLYIWTDLKDTFHVASYNDIPDEKWTEVQKWLQKRLNTAQERKGIEQQPSLFDEKE